MKNSALSIIFCFTSFCLFGQLGPYKVFDFAHLPSNARVSGLAGSVISIQDEDVALGQQNPALLNSQIHNQLSVSQEFHFSGINYGYTSYGWHFDSLGISMHAGAQYISYGTFDRANDLGIKDGQFDASEIGLSVGAAKKINERISVGTNIRFLNATYDIYSSSGMAFDLGLHYGNPNTNFGFGAVIKNIGWQFNPFADIKEGVRHDIQIGVSKKLKHLPFRYAIVAHNLQQWNIRYKDPADVETDILGAPIEESNFRANVDNLFRHLNFSGEFLLGKREQLRLRTGYSHLRSAELGVLTFRSLTGFSFGLGINIKKIKLDYGVTCYHLEGGTNHLTLRMNFVDMFRKI